MKAVLVFLSVMLSLPVAAQAEAPPKVAPVAAKAASAPVAPTPASAPTSAVPPAPAADDLAERTRLAVQLHDIRSIRAGINANVQVASRKLPEAQREDFIRYMGLHLDYGKIEAQSVKDVAEIYTVPELKAMIAYYGSPEGQSADAKSAEYQDEILPFVLKEIDALYAGYRFGDAPMSTPKK